MRVEKYGLSSGFIERYACLVFDVIVFIRDGGELCVEFSSCCGVMC